MKSGLPVGFDLAAETFDDAQLLGFDDVDAACDPNRRGGGEQGLIRRRRHSQSQAKPAAGSSLPSAGRTLSHRRVKPDRIAHLCHHGKALRDRSTLSSRTELSITISEAI